MRINKKLKFVFISTPKAGTHTIYKILKDHFPGTIEAGFHNNRIVNSYQKYFRWTVVRNPFSRAVSIWWSACRLAHKDQYKFRVRCGAKDDFDRFIKWFVNASDKERGKEPLMQNQSTWLTPVEPITAIHLEHLRDELEQLPFWKEGIDLPQLNTTKQKRSDRGKEEGKWIKDIPWQEFYSHETIDAVRKWAELDFERFGYSERVL